MGGQIETPNESQNAPQNENWPLYAARRERSANWKTILEAAIAYTKTNEAYGRVRAVDGLLIHAKNIRPTIGSQCKIGRSAIAEVVSVNDKGCALLSYADTRGVQVGDEVHPMNGSSVFAGPAMLGRIVNGLGKPIDNKGPLRHEALCPLYAPASSLLERPLIQEQLFTGVRVIDGFTSVGKGQRMGIFAGSGVGKSTLLGMIARHVRADVNIVALIGERAREVREFVEYELGEEGLRRSIVVVASSDEGASIRIRCAHLACALAEYFRDAGKDVVLYMDSLTRVARAQRELGLFRGEVPAARGYPPSLDGVLSSIVERCGTSVSGSITGFFTVLVDGDDTEEPVSDTVRGLIDGHIILSRNLAQLSHYPAVDVPRSLSRLALKVCPKDVLEAAAYVRSKMSLYEQSKDIINAGVYTPGTNPPLDIFLKGKPKLDAFLQQGIGEHSDEQAVRAGLLAVRKIV